MPVDTSFYPTQQAPPFNPLTTIQGYAGAAQTLGENQLLQQQIRGRAALGKALQSSTNPDGSVNTNALTRAISQDPDAAWMTLQVQHEAEQGNQLTNFMGKDAQGRPQQQQLPLPQALARSSTGQQTQQPPSQDKIDGWHKHVDAISGILDQLDTPDVQQTDVIKGVTDAMGHSDVQGFNGMDAASALSSLPHGPGGSPASSQQLQTVIQQKKQQVGQLKQNLNAKYPSSDRLAAQQQQTQNAQQPASASPDNTQPQPDQSTEGLPVALPMGYEENQQDMQHHFQQVRTDSEGVGQSNAVLSKILNLSKAKTPTGQYIGKVYEYLASRGLATPGIEKQAEQLQEITKSMAQVALSGGMPGSDSRLEALESANVHPEQLPGTIQNLVPFLQAVNKGKLAKANYYRSTAGDGTMPDKVQQAQSNWQNYFDPRILEYQDLSPADKTKYVQNLTPQEAKILAAKRDKLQQLGVQ